MKKNTNIIEFPKQNIKKEQKNKFSKRKRKINFLNLFFVVFLLYFINIFTSQKSDLNVLNSQIAEKELELESATTESKKLESYTTQINDEEFYLEVVEDIARTRYNMVKHDEIIYFDKSKTDNKFIEGIGFDQNDNEDE